MITKSPMSRDGSVLSIVDVMTSEMVTIKRSAAPMKAPCTTLFLPISVAKPTDLITLATRSGSIPRKNGASPVHVVVVPVKIILKILDKRNNTTAVVIDAVATDKSDCCFRL